jgi:hypothetical protein
MSAEPYVVVHLPEHPNSNTQGKVREHVFKASKALGKAIPGGVHVHHVDGNPKNNMNSNLVICSASYHRLIHARTRAYNETGNANLMKCAYCHTYDDPSNMYVRPVQYQAWHLECRSKSRRVLAPKTGPYKRKLLNDHKT